ncbi:MAG TPA: glycerophosphoryl diester phosphodiesterase membrane domain-containing protein [Terracidiphilus sp.]|nr:glycerophosphoryl diester phosphodiesterase membrane domain-containing protein [Terracidiphilus sp.]
METNLRPLTLGEILDRTAQLYRENFLLFAGIAAVYAGVLLVLSLIQIGIQEWMRAEHMIRELVWATGIGVLVLWIAIFICGGLAVAANNRAVAWVHLGEPATIRGAYSSILPQLGRYLWLMTITAFRVWTPCVLLYIAYLALAVFYLRPQGALRHHGASPDMNALLIFGVASFIFAILLLGAIIYAIIMGLRYSLAVPACVVEGLRARQAIRRSIDLSKGARGRIFVLGLLVLAIQIGLALVTQLFFIIATVQHHGVLPVGIRALQQIVAFFTNTFVAPIYATGLTLFYYDQRVRNEGFDIERMMQSAGLTPPPPAAPSFEPVLEIPVETAADSSIPEPGRVNE